MIMSKKTILITIASFILGLQTANAQLFEYNKEQYDNGQYEDVCKEYLRNIFNIGDKRIQTLGKTNYSLPNGNTFVFMRIKWIAITYYEEYQVPGGMVGSINKTETIYQRNQIDDAKRCAVVVNREGTPVSWFKIPDNFSIWKLEDGILCFLMDKSEIKVDNDNRACYNYIKCLDYDGNLLWEAGNDFMAFDFIKTDNNLYLAGEKVGDVARSLVRGMDIKTGKVVREKVGNAGNICLMLSVGDDGLEVHEFLNDINSYRQFTIPFEANDKSYHFRQLMSKYDQRKASDQIAIGERYLEGRGFEKDEKKAFEWFQKAANQNDSKGLCKLGYCYQNGYGVMQDKKMAVNYFEKSANLHNTDAIIILSDMYAEGDGIEKNMSKALYWKEMLAFNGNLNAQKYVLANQSMEYEKVDLTADDAFKKGLDSHKEKSYEWAKFCFERAIKLGSKDAMLFYGEWLYFGDGILKDCNKAIEYLTKLGEEDNNKYAQKMLGLIYHENKGVAPDIKKEIYWTAKAADNGDVDSQLKLGYAYRNGIGVKKNNKLAFAMYEKAALQGNPVGVYNMVYCYSTGEGVKKDKYSAILWFKKMDTITQLKTADSFYNGDGLKKNLELAAMMYKELSDNGNIQATKKLAMCYLDGVGVDKSIYTAHELIKKIDYSNDGNMYYIEAQYYEKLNKNTFKPSGNVVEMYRRAIKYGCKRAVEDFIRYQKKYGLKLDINGSSY
jgi:TPR repeat protein